MKKNLEKMQVKVANKRAILESHDGEEFSPITVAKNVLCEDGTTMQDYFDNHSEPNISTKIVNSNSMSKVGQGDNVDFSDNVMNGAYESMVLKGKSMVNCIQEPSSQDVVLPYEFEDGQYVTINDTKEDGALGVELKGQTLVNLVPRKIIDHIASSDWDGYCCLVQNSKQSFDQWRALQDLKPNTKYYISCYVETFEDANDKDYCLNNPSTESIFEDSMTVNGVGRYQWLSTTKSELTDEIFIVLRSQNALARGAIKIRDIMIIEYQEGMENLDIPYFEGMASCKVPILKTVGKNLLDPTMVKNEWYPFKLKKGTTLTLSTKDSVPSEGGNICFKDGNNQDVWFSIDASTTKRTMTLNTDVYQISNMLQGNIEYQMEYGSTATTFESYKTSILSLPEEVVLRSLPNGVCDTFNTRTGVYTQRIGEAVVNGSENWQLNNTEGTTTQRFFCDMLANSAVDNNTKGTQQYLCDKLRTITWSQTCELGVTINGSGVFVYNNSIEYTVSSVKQWLSQNPVKLQYELATPVVTKINLPSTLKSWNTTTHIYSEIPENTLYPILSHSNPSYPVILKPSTKYSIVANSYSNDHTNSAINFNLGGATASTVVGNHVTTITTPSTLSNELLTMSGRGNKLNNVMVIEGDVVGDEPYFEGLCDAKTPILSNVGENLFDVDGEFVKGAYSYGVPVLSSSNQAIEKIGENSLHITCGTNFYHSGWGQIIDVKNLDSVTISVMSTFSNSLTTPELKVLCLYESEEVPTTMDGQKKTDYDNRYLTQTLNDTNKTYTRTINTRGFAKVYVLFTGGYKAGGQGTFDFTLHNIYVGEESTYHGYEPYKSNTTTFASNDDEIIVLRSLPNGVCDTLNVKTGEYVQNIGEIVLDGSEGENWIMYPLNDEFPDVAGFYCSYPNAKQVIHSQIPNYLGSLSPFKDERFPGMLNTNEEGVGLKDNRFCKVSILKSKLSSITKEGLKQWLSQNPITAQYELATPIVKQVNVEGYPYAYENGHILLESGSQEQSLTPTIEYSIVANRGGQIRSNQRMVERHQKKLDSLYAMTLVNMIDSQYKQVLMKLKSELGSEVISWDI